VHRDHYTLAAVLGHEHGSEVSLGAAEKPALDLLHAAIDGTAGLVGNPFLDVLRTAGADEVAEQWAAAPHAPPDPAGWRYPTTWLEGDQRIELGSRSLDAVHTPGHTPGHFVYADRAAGLLFAGDHVLPTITPSIGFTVPAVANPLGDFMASLTRVRSLPDLTVLPAHGPVAPSSHARVDELLRHHEDRLASSLAALDGGPRTAHEVAQRLPWTRHDHPYPRLDVFAQGMASMETKAHLDLLVAQGRATCAAAAGGGAVRYARAEPMEGSGLSG
jgi:glyoxylase-like metal-dependent hydrolase (beta-lactamase superfamily II)